MGLLKNPNFKPPKEKGNPLPEEERYDLIISVEQLNAALDLGKPGSGRPIQPPKFRDKNR